MLSVINADYRYNLPYFKELILKFSDLNLDSSLLSTIEKSGFAEATPIQAQAIPLVLQKKDVSGLAQTGTGKTAAFVLPLMERVLCSRPRTESELSQMSEESRLRIQERAFADWRSPNFILILVPTRELAEQVTENIEKFSVDSGVRCVSVYGGTSYDKQKDALSRGVEFVVATPGRLIDLYKEHILDLKQVRAIVFDEADRMFDMGFKDDMKYILQRVPQDRQFLVFSATLNFDVLNTAYQFGAEPIEINISRDQAKADNVRDEIFHVGQDEKPMYLLSLFKKHNPKQVIVFSNFKMKVERISAFLSSNGYPAVGISSLLSQAQRNRVIEQFKTENEKNILVATDVAARGLDIKGVDLVINYDLPQDAESYVHRIGRTGRAGTEGQAFSLVSDQDVESLSRVEEYLKHKIQMGWFEDTDLIKDFKPMPAEQYRDKHNREGYKGHQRTDGHKSERPFDRQRNYKFDERKSTQQADGPRKESRNHFRDKQHKDNKLGQTAADSAQFRSGVSHSSQNHKPKHPTTSSQNAPKRHHASVQTKVGAKKSVSWLQKITQFFKGLVTPNNKVTKKLEHGTLKKDEQSSSGQKASGHHKHKSYGHRNKNHHRRNYHGKGAKTQRHPSRHAGSDKSNPK